MATKGRTTTLATVSSTGTVSNKFIAESLRICPCIADHIVICEQFFQLHGLVSYSLTAIELFLIVIKILQLSHSK